MRSKRSELVVSHFTRTDKSVSKLMKLIPRDIKWLISNFVSVIPPFDYSIKEYTPNDYPSPIINDSGLKLTFNRNSTRSGWIIFANSTPIEPYSGTHTFLFKCILREKWKGGNVSWEISFI